MDAELRKLLPNVKICDEETDSNVCSDCGGSGWEVLPGKGARACHCKTAGLYERLLAKSNIPSRYRDCTLREFKTGNNFELRKIRNQIIEFVNLYPVVERGILFVGSVGTGKTHLAVSLLKGVMKKGAPGLFYEFGALLKEIQDSYNPISKTSELSVLAPVFDAEVLVLDELGAAKPTEWVHETMMHIINTRYNDKKLTIFTTNYLDERKHEREEILQDRIGARLRSRLYEMCDLILIEAEDYRRRTK